MAVTFLGGCLCGVDETEGVRCAAQKVKKSVAVKILHSSQNQSWLGNSQGSEPSSIRRGRFQARACGYGKVAWLQQASGHNRHGSS